MSSRSSKSISYEQPSRLKYVDKVCGLCLKKLQIRIVSSRTVNHQKLFYCCDEHRFQSWCNPVNEDEVDSSHGPMDGNMNELKYLQAVKDLGISVESLATLFKFGFAVLFFMVIVLTILILVK